MPCRAVTSPASSDAAPHRSAEPLRHRLPAGEPGMHGPAIGIAVARLAERERARNRQWEMRCKPRQPLVLQLRLPAGPLDPREPHGHVLAEPEDGVVRAGRKHRLRAAGSAQAGNCVGEQPRGRAGRRRPARRRASGRRSTATHQASCLRGAPRLPPLLPLLRLGPGVELPLQHRQLALELLVAVPPLQARAGRRGAPPSPRTRAPGRGRSRRTGSARRARRRRRTPPRSRPSPRRAAARASPACRGRSRRPARRSARAAWSCGGRGRRAAGLPWP